MPRFTESEVKDVAKEMNVSFDTFTLSDLLEGMNLETDHDEVTGGDPVKIAEIAIEHLKERSDYYKKLEKYVEKKNASDFPKFYYARHMTAGLCGYDDETILVDVETVKKLGETFNGKPIYIQHQDVDLDTMKQDSVGYVTETFYDMDGWLWSKIMVTDDEGHAVINKGWAVSNAYVPTEWGSGGMKNNLPYDREVLNGSFTHLALVPNPRYEDAKIYTPEQYQARNTQLLNSLAHSKTEETKGFKMKFFKTKKEEVSEIDSATSVELQNDKGETIEVSVKDMISTVLNSLKPAPKKIKVGDTEMTFDELQAAYKNAKKNEAESKEEKKTESEDDDEMENESEEDDEDLENESCDEKGEKKNAKNDHFKELQNAGKGGSQSFATIDTTANKMARGKSRYGL